MIQESNPNHAPAPISSSAPASSSVNKPGSKAPRRPEPFPKERVAKQIALKKRAMKQALPKERERVAKQDLRLARQREKQKEKRRMRALKKADRKQEVLRKAKKAASRSRLVKRLTKAQYVCTLINFHARRYQLRRPNVKNRGRRMRKKKQNKWLRVCIGRSVVTSPRKKAVLNSMRVDYKNTRLLKHFISFQGKIMNRKQNRVSAKSQRVLKRVIKTSRNAGLLPSLQG